MIKEDNFSEKQYFVNIMGRLKAKDLELSDLEILDLLDKFAKEGKRFKRITAFQNQVRKYKNVKKGEVSISLNNNDFNKQIKKLKNMGLIMLDKERDVPKVRQGFTGFLMPNFTNLFGMPTNNQKENFKKYEELLERFHNNLYGVGKSVLDFRKPTARKFGKII